MSLLTYVVEKVISRIGNSISTSLDYTDLLFSVILSLAVAIVALLIGFKSSFLQFTLPKESWKVFLRIILITLFFPAIAEEIIFRVSLLPNIVEKATILEQLLWSGISLVLFTVYHPVNAKLFYPAALETFTNFIFLILSTILGIACTISYLLSGSLWLPVGIHWLTVITWLLLLGGYKRLNQPRKSKDG